MIFNGFIPVGSNHITNDLSVMLHTPPAAAEKIKTEYGSLIKNYSASNDLGVTKVKIPRIGDEETHSEVALDYIQTIIHARIEEILVLVKNKLKKSGILDNAGSGIVITGGMSNLEGVKALSEKIFDGIPIAVSNPKNIENGYMSFDDSKMSTIVGLLVYSLGINRNYELDSSKKLMKPVKKQQTIVEEKTINNNSMNTKSATSNEAPDLSLKNDDPTILTPLTKDKKKGVSKFWSKVSEWF